MAENPFRTFYEALKRFLSSASGPGTEETQVKYARREKITVFIAAYIMALSLWFIVNLNSSFSVTIDMPLELGEIPEEQALTQSLPASVSVEMSGDGWKLLGLYNDPPSISVDVSQQEVNLLEQVRQRLSAEQDLTVSSVSPILISIELEEKASKMIPVRVQTDIAYQPRFGMIGEPRIFPDSLLITGARSQIRDYEEWVIRDTLRMEEVNQDIAVELPVVNDNQLVRISADQISYSADVSEFTEGESRVYISTRELPRGQNINYNPSTVTIRYDVPIEQYSRVADLNIFEAYVTYDQILADSTGFITPEIEVMTDEYEIRVRSFQPFSVAYFSVLDQ